MSDERKLTKEDREKIQRLLESCTLENVTHALSLIEETAGQEDIADIFTMNVIVELICLGDPVLQATNIMRRCPNTSKLFVEALSNPFSMTSRDYRSRKSYLGKFTTFSSSALAELVNNESDIKLDGLTSLSVAAAESLSKYEGHLSLNGLTELPDAAAESLSKHEGHLDLRGLTSLSEAAAKSLSKHEGNLMLTGLASLSDGPGHIALAESLSRHEGELNLDGLTSVSDAAAESLSKHEGTLMLAGLTELSVAAAESLSKHEGYLSLDGLTELSDDAAESLAKRVDKFQSWHITLANLPASAAKILRDAGHGE